MKKILLPLFCLPFLSVAQSQSAVEIRFYLMRVQDFRTESSLDQINGFGNELTSKQCQNLGVQKVTIETGSKEGKLHKTVYDLTDLGLISKMTTSNRTVNYSYVQDSLLTSVVSTGKVNATTKYTYFNNLLTKKEVFRKDRLTARTLLDYGANDKLVFSMHQEGRNLKTSYALSNEYVNDKLSRQDFVRNNRVLRTWDYSCEPKGELVDSKTYSTICKVREENNDGSYSEHTRKFENGEVLLFIYHFNKDSVNFASSCEKESGEKMWESTSSDNERKFVYYSKKGAIDRTYTSRFDADGRIIETESTYGKKQKKTSKMVNVYNEEGLIVEKKSHYRGKLTYIRKFSYVQ